MRAVRPPPSSRTRQASTRSRRRARVPKLRASVPVTRPRGNGRAAVRAMRASISASYHMLSAPDAPAPMAIERMAIKPMTGCSEPGAATMADERRQNDERHHARLHQLNIVANARLNRSVSAWPISLCIVIVGTVPKVASVKGGVLKSIEQSSSTILRVGGGGPHKMEPAAKRKVSPSTQ